MFVGLSRVSAVVLTIFTLSLVPPVTGASDAFAKTATTTKSKTVKKKGKPAAAVNTTAQNGYLAAHYSSIVVDADTGHVLSDADADSQSHPASLTKMMTLYLLFDSLTKGEVRMTTKIKASAWAAQQSRSKLNVRKGQTITVDQAIEAIITLSANDVAVMVAEKLGGTEEKFADMMTTKAHQIGMTSTVFANASGLPNPNQITTARDMAVLGKRLMTDFPQYYPMFARTDFTYSGQKIHTHNHLIDPNLPLFYEGADGIKTGYTAASGFNLVSSARRDNKRIIAVVLGGATAWQRDKHMADLMDDGFEILNGHPERAIAARKIDAFQPTRVAVVPQDETEAETSAGDKEEQQPIARLPKRAAITGESLPPAPPSVEAAVPAPALKTLPPPKPQQLAKLDQESPVSLPIPGGQNVGQDPQALAEAKAAARADLKELTKTAPTAKAPSKEKKVAALPPATSGKAPGWGIQVGAFSSASTAQEQAEAAVAKLRTTFSAATAVVERAVVSGKALYRARVHGLPQKELVRACAIVGKGVKGACKAVPPDAVQAAG